MKKNMMLLGAVRVSCIAVSCVPFVGNLNKDETFSLLYTAEGQSILKIVSILTYNVPCTRKG